MKIAYGRNLKSTAIDFDSSEPFYINNCGFQFLDDNKDVRVNRPIGRKDYQIICVVGGTLSIRVGEKTIFLKKGDIYVYPPEIPQHYTMEASTENKFFWIHFSGYLVPYYLQKCNIRPLIKYSGISSHIVENTIKKITSELQAKKNSFEIKTVALFLSLLSEISRQLAATDKNQNEKIRNIQLRIDADYSDTKSIAAYAYECEMSVQNFIQKFKKEIGVTPNDYITQKRIDAAKELLINTDMKIAEIAQACGYTEPQYFARIFKKRTGITPSSYRS